MNVRLEAQRFLAEFLRHPVEYRFVLGTNVFARSVLDACDIRAFVDDFTAASSLEGKPVVKARDLPSGAVVINASLARTLRAKSLLDDLGVLNFDFLALQRFTGLPLKPVRQDPWPQWELDYFLHEAEYSWVRTRLDDHASRQVFDRLIAYRLSGDIRDLQGFRFGAGEQYFDAFPVPEGSVFFDVGAFDGETTKRFLEIGGEASTSVMFEPDPTNARELEGIWQGDPRVTLFECALGAESGEARFASGQGSASHLGDSGSERVTIRTLDSLDCPAPTFIKMDIEGGEVDALMGASETIRRERPRMAICVYHRPSDLWQIPKFVLNLVPEYRLRLGHYTEGQFESVMYFDLEAEQASVKMSNRT